MKPNKGSRDCQCAAVGRLAATRKRNALWGDAWCEVTRNARSAGASRLLILRKRSEHWVPLAACQPVLNRRNFGKTALADKQPVAHTFWQSILFSEEQ
jgi:hypothetical protein